MEEDLRFPLSWPANWERTKHREDSRFGKKRTFAQARDELIRQLNLLNATSVVLSTNVQLRNDGLPYSRYKEPSDPGVAVYFRLNKLPKVLACDRWDRVRDNMWAIAKHIDAMRGMERWGVGSLEQAFMGYQALPEKVEQAWWRVLQVDPNASWDDIRAAYRAIAKTAHPDAGGDRHQWDRINAAYLQAEVTKRMNPA